MGGRVFQLVTADPSEWGGAVVPILATVPGPVRWGKPRRVTLTAATVGKLAPDAENSRILAEIHNMDSANVLYVSPVDQDVGKGRPVQPLDTYILAHDGEIFGYSSSAIEVCVCEFFLKAGGG